MSAANPYASTTPPPQRVRLNIGAGGVPLNGYDNLDIKSGTDCTKLSHADNSVDEIYASHVLEHWPYEKTAEVLLEWVRALKPGGRLRVSVPDFDLLVKAYSQGTTLNVEGILLGGHVDADDYHKAIFTRDKLAKLMRLAGLKRIARWTPEHEDCSKLPISLNLEGYKQRVTAIERTVMTMTLPRLCFTDNMFCCMQALIALKLPILRSTGVFWSAGMTQVFNDAINGGAKYILHVDYDSVFSPEDVVDLYSLMEERSDIDALCAIQMHREQDTPLMVMAGPDGKRISGVGGETMMADTMPIEAGHFGLTMLRADKVAALPKPWFVGVPDANGGWDTGRVDDDIWFWKQWKKAGNTLHAANAVRIGHIQRMISWMGRGGRAVHQYMGDYGDSGRPLEVA